uniref:Uncharacterized protein n=1 Tax=Amphimedon queenslandica TaxID=400682 RepID=A0A1X7UX33_AMPQE
MALVSLGPKASARTLSSSKALAVRSTVRGRGMMLFFLSSSSDKTPGSSW